MGTSCFGSRYSLHVREKQYWTDSKKERSNGPMLPTATVFAVHAAVQTGYPPTSPRRDRFGLTREQSRSSNAPLW